MNLERNGDRQRFFGKGKFLQPESLHPRSPLEWWFVQGSLQGHRVPLRHFLACLIRHTFQNPGIRPEQSFSLFLSELDSGMSRHAVATRCDQKLVDILLGRKEMIERLNIDPLLTGSYIEELRDNRAFPGITVTASTPTITADPLSICWEDFSFSQESDGFRLTFKEPGQKRYFRLSLVPRGPAMTIAAARRIPGLRMMYRTYPRLKLTGSMGGVRVEGEAWLDHQWGDYSWLVAALSSPKVLGWEWFGVNGDDGSDWVIMIHRDSRSGRPVAKHATLRRPDGTIRISSDVLMRVLRRWVSPSTYIRHPVDWRIVLPELKADFTFRPHVDDQEVPVLNPMRAIWEGAGLVAGTVAGKPFSGRARGEFQGYGYMFDFEKEINRFKSRVAQHLEDFFPKSMTDGRLCSYVGPPTWKYEPAAYTEMLSVPIWDLVSREGKKWRPIFGLLLLNALGKDPAPYEALISVLGELFHTGALIIDDIEDRSLFRRGAECIHLRYGEDVAINAANTVYFLPTLPIFNHPALTSIQKLKLQKIMMHQFVRAHLGQALDLYWSRNMSRAMLEKWLDGGQAEKILQMYEFKTAAPIEGLAEAAAVIAGSSPTLRRACMEFAKAFGIAFQIMDDIHGFGDSPRWRKVCGEDLSEGKLTYIIHKTLLRLEKEDREKLIRILSSKRLRKDKQFLREGVALVRQSQALILGREEAKSLVEPPWRNLAGMLPPSQSKLLLRMLCRSLMDLDFSGK